MLVVPVEFGNRLIGLALAKHDDVAIGDLAGGATVPRLMQEGGPPEYRDRVPVSLIKATKPDEVNDPHLMEAWN